MAITEDASAPPVATSTAAPGTLTTASFSPPAGSMVVAIAAGQYVASGTPTITFSDSGGNTWSTAVTSTKSSTQSSVGKIGYCFPSGGSMTVSAAYTLTQGQYLKVYVLTGVDSAQTGATQTAQPNASTAFTATITTTTTNSQVYGIVNNSNTAAAFTANGNSTKVDEYQNATAGATSATIKGTNVTGTPGATAFGATVGTAAYGVVALWEVLPSSGPTVKNAADAFSFTGTATVAMQAADTVGFTDTAAVTGNPIHPPTGDAFAFTDTARVIVRAADTIGFTDNAIASTTIQASDTFSFADTATGGPATVATIFAADTFSFTDTAVTVATIHADDTITFTDGAHVVGIPPPATRIEDVDAEDRYITVLAEDRHLVVEHESRISAVPYEVRYLTVGIV